MVYPVRCKRKTAKQRLVAAGGESEFKPQISNEGDMNGVNKNIDIPLTFASFLGVYSNPRA